jgi:hypothetical protein
VPVLTYGFDGQPVQDFGHRKEDLEFVRMFVHLAPRPNCTVISSVIHVVARSELLAHLVLSSLLSRVWKDGNEEGRVQVMWNRQDDKIPWA